MKEAGQSGYGILSKPITIFLQTPTDNIPQIINNTTEPLIVSFSDIDTNGIVGVWTGEENINLDPEFIDPVAGNYCIDSCYSPHVQVPGLILFLLMKMYGSLLLTMTY